VVEDLGDLMRTPFGLVIIAISSLSFFGCAKKEAPKISLVVPKGYAKATKIASGSWEDQLKQKLALGDAAQAELTRIPYLSAADQIFPGAGKTAIAQNKPAEKKNQTWYSPLIPGAKLKSAIVAWLPRASKTVAPSTPTKKKLAVAKSRRSRRVISSRAKKPAHMLAGR
jgi:hypothetical protein